MRPFTSPVRVAVMNKAALEDRFANRAKGMMNDAVAERGGGNDPVLRIENLNLLVTAGAIAPTLELALQLEHFPFKVGKNAATPGLERMPLAARTAAALSASNKAMRSNRLNPVAEQEFPTARESFNGRHQPQDEAVVSLQSGAGFACLIRLCDAATDCLGRHVSQLPRAVRFGCHTILDKGGLAPL